MLGLGVGVSALLKTDIRLDTFLSVFKSWQPFTATSEQSRPETPMNPPEMHPQVTPIASAPSQPQPPVATPTVQPVPGPVPVPDIVPPAPPPVTKPSAAAQTSQDDRRSTHGTKKARSGSVAKQRGDHRRPHDNNYVWSQELNALVPVSSMAKSDSGVADSPPDSPRKAPSRIERPNPFERNELAPPRLHESTIAPATTGTPTPERPAPNADKAADPFES